MFQYSNKDTNIPENSSYHQIQNIVLHFREISIVLEACALKLENKLEPEAKVI